jgi:hypothetical protein
MLYFYQFEGLLSSCDFLPSCLMASIHFNFWNQLEDPISFEHHKKFHEG